MTVEDLIAALQAFQVAHPGATVVRPDSGADGLGCVEISRVGVVRVRTGFREEMAVALDFDPEDLA